MIIFRNSYSVNIGPIFNVHSEMLKKLREAEKNWKEDFCVGKVIVGFAPELLKAYPTFVNFVERTKQKIAEYDRRNPRFHAFLKKCERRPECHRQPLKGEFWLFSNYGQTFIIYVTGSTRTLYYF